VPFLQFSRDRRGYESTYLVKAPRRRGEKDRLKLLYWFRSPPHVKLGRAAFDEDAIRALEEQHPDVEFDWPRILAARPPAAEPPESSRLPRRTTRRPEGGAQGPVPTTLRAARPQAPAPSPAPTPKPAARLNADSTPAAAPAPPARDEPIPSRFVRIFDAPETLGGDLVAAGPEAPEGDAAPAGEMPHRLSERTAVERRLGSDQLNRLRGQYAAALARIGARVTDLSLADALRAVAERANPDTWVTEGDVEAGLSGLGAVYAELGRSLGRRRRRRWGKAGEVPPREQKGATAAAGTDAEPGPSASEEPPVDASNPDDFEPETS
jgi:hypothetical protein